MPQDQDIDPRIAPAGPRIAGQTQGRIAIIPWTHPREGAFFDLRDDPVGHFAVEARARASGLVLISHVLSPSRIAPAAGVAGVGGRSEPAGPPTEAGSTQGAATIVEEPGHGPDLRLAAVGLEGSDAHPRRADRPIRP